MVPSDSLDLSSLDLAIHSLKRGLTRYRKDEEDLEVRDACIQRFEYSYELCLKFIKRALTQMSASEQTLALLSFKDQLRLAADAGLIKDPVAWFRYRESRNKTSHTYDSDTADEVMIEIPKFYKSSFFLIEKLKKIYEA